MMGKGSLKCRNLYRNPRNHDGTGSLAGTFAETRKSRWQSASYHRNLYRNPRNHDGKGSLSAGTCGPEPANHGQSWWQRVSEAPEPFTGTRKSWWQRVSLFPEPLPEPEKSWWQRVSLAPEPLPEPLPEPKKSWWQRVSLAPEPLLEPWTSCLQRVSSAPELVDRNQEIMMAKGLWSAGTFTGTQEIMMAKGLWSAWTFSGTRKSSWHKASLPPEPFYRNPRNHDGRGSL